MDRSKYKSKYSKWVDRSGRCVDCDHWQKMRCVLNCSALVRSVDATESFVTRGFTLAYVHNALGSARGW